MNAHPLIEHVLETLPADIHRRRAVLNSLVELVRPEIVPTDVRSMPGDLDSHLRSQRELVFGTRGTGRLGDTPLRRSSPNDKLTDSRRE